MSSEDFKSLIVTDPDLVDEGIDVSGLRTQTDTSPFLLGNIPDYSGIQYDYLGPTKYSDLMRLYMQGLPAIDTAQIPGAVDTLVNTGDGGQGTAPVTSDSTATPIIPIEPGTFTAESLDESFAGEEGPITQPVTGGSPGILNPATYANTGDPDLLDLAGGEAGGADGFGIIDEVEPYRDPIMDMVEQPQTDSILAGEAMSRSNTGLEDDFLNLIGQENAEIEDIPVQLPSTNIETAIDPQAVRTILGPDGITYDAVTRQPIYEDLDAQAAATDLTLGTQDLVTQEDIEDNTSLLQKLGLPADFDLKQAAIEAGINLAVGLPITLIAKGLGAVVPEYEPTFQQRTLTDELGLTDDRKFSGDPTTSAFAGLNAFGQFGDPVETAKDKIDTRLENIENKNYGPGDKFYDDTQTMIEEYNRVTNKLGDIDAIPTGDAQIAEETIGTLPEITEARQEQGEQIQEIQQQEVVQSGSNEADRQQRDTGVSKVAENRYETKSGDVYASAAEAAEKSDGGGGGSSSSKVVCTMMNESYGFGSFRNKIWMKFHKDLSPEYQRGYHKLFLPLVKIAKKNMIVKKVLEHIAVHSTIDMRQATRGKMHLLGRVYRKILLPLCYWVGKNAK